MFYHYRQNNSGGTYFGPRHIIIEATSIKEANKKFWSLPYVYRDGGGDCTCCGSRWYELLEDVDYGTECPQYYDLILKVDFPNLYLSSKDKEAVSYSILRSDDVDLGKVYWENGKVGDIVIKKEG